MTVVFWKTFSLKFDSSVFAETKYRGTCRTVEDNVARSEEQRRDTVFIFKLLHYNF